MVQSIYGILELEDAGSIFGFSLVNAAHASGGAFLQASTTATATATMTVTGRPGLYDLRVAYFDENDGVAWSAIKVDGVTVGSWAWDQDLGSAFAGVQTLTTHMIRNVLIDTEAVVTFEGRANGGESLRVDRIDLLPAAARDIGPEGLASFAGAEGYGSTTAGGRGGWIVKVTNLDDSGVGSLRWALEELTAPRIVVFDVGGTIALKDEIKVRGDVTVAGQTAPGDGITLTGARLKVVGDDVIIRGLHIRPGDGAGMDPSDRDAISVGAINETVERVIIDGNSFTWAVDENASTWYGARDVTYSNNIIAEGLDRSIHPEGAHSMGSLVGGGSQRVTLIGNLFASNNHRNPQIGQATQIEIINNLVYNYGDNGLEVNVGGSAHATVHAIGNMFIAGADSASNRPVRLLGDTAGTRIYLHDNLGWSRTAASQPETDIAEGAGRSRITTTPVFVGSGASALSASEVRDYVLAHVGARGQGLDRVDARILAGVLDGSGRIIDSPAQVASFTPRAVRTTLADSDGDGVPDGYERMLGFDHRTFDAHGDTDRDGYSNIEEYINGLITGFDIDVSALPAPAGQFIEAEALTRISGFRWVANGAASGGRVIEARGDAVAGMTFDGETGSYDIRVNHFDETDGVSRMAVYADGRLLDTWTWDKDLGSAGVSRKTLTTHTIPDVQLQEGTQIRLVGWGDANEPLRVDSISIVGKAATPVALPVTVQAEAMTLISGFQPVPNGAASGGRVIQAKGDAIAALVFEGGPGLYRVALDYFDENDGVSRAALRVDGRLIDAWDWDMRLGSAFADQATLVKRTIEDVRLYEGSVVEIVGWGHSAEPLRIDAISFTPDALL